MEQVTKLVFKTEKGTPATDSLLVAKHLGRRHDNIMKACRRLMEKETQGKEFHHIKQSKYKQYFIMTRAGFEYLTTNIHGIEEARQDFFAQFDAMTNDRHEAEPKPEETPKVEEVTTAVVVATPNIGDVIHIQDNPQGFVVDARELKQFLNPGTEFSTWFKRRVEHCGFAINEDFVPILHNEKVEQVNSWGGSNRIDYTLTLDAAKELCMIEGGDLGRTARRYFIEAEKKLKAIQPMTQPATPALPQTFAQALRLAAEQAETIEAQQKQLAAQAPKVNFANALETAGHSILIGQLAKLLRQNGVDTGEIRLYQWLRDHGFLHKTGSEYNNPTQSALERGLFELKTGVRYHPHTQEPIQTFTTLVTVKGQNFFINRLVYQNQQCQ